jgi:hypothetical protein
VDYSRNGESGLFGKCDQPLTVNVSEATRDQLQAGATHAGVPLSEYIRAILEAHVWGTAEVMARSLQKRMPAGIRRITGESP